jgi:hypothetical protein
MNKSSGFAGILLCLRSYRPGVGNLVGSAFCPVCEPEGGRSRSLSVKVVEDKLLLKCHAPDACSIEAICQALGITVSDLFLGAHGPTREREFVRQYVYKNDRGEPAHKTVRWKDKLTGKKSFSQHGPSPTFDPNKEPGRDNPFWCNQVTGLTLYPYRLPELLHDLRQDSGAMVLVVEGEQAVDALRSRGLVATCNPMGAGKWQPTYSRWLLGANVVVYADNDQPGISHAQQVCTQLFGVVAQIKLLHFPETPAKSGLDDLLNNMTTSTIREKVAWLHGVVRQTRFWLPQGVPLILRHLADLLESGEQQPGQVAKLFSWAQAEVGMLT